MDDLVGRLGMMAKYEGKYFQFLLAKAEPLFRKKGEILQELDRIDPSWGWLIDGARFIRSTNRGGDEFALSGLKRVLANLREKREPGYVGCGHSRNVAVARPKSGKRG